MDKSCSSSGEVFSVCVGKNECRPNFVDAGFANSEEEKTPLGPAWEDGQAWKNPRWGTERNAWQSTSLLGHGPTFTLRWCLDLTSMWPECIWKSESSRAIGFCLLVQAEWSRESGMSHHADCHHLERSARAWAGSCSVSHSLLGSLHC